MARHSRSSEAAHDSLAAVIAGLTRSWSGLDSPRSPLSCLPLRHHGNAINHSRVPSTPTAAPFIAFIGD